MPLAIYQLSAFKKQCFSLYSVLEVHAAPAEHSVNMLCVMISHSSHFHITRLHKLPMVMLKKILLHANIAYPGRIKSKKHVIL